MSDDRKKAVGQVLDAIRREKGLTLWEVAHELGTSAVSVSRYCRGLKYPRLYDLVNLARAFRTPPAVLASRIENALRAIET